MKSLQLSLLRNTSARSISDLLTSLGSVKTDSNQTERCVIGITHNVKICFVAPNIRWRATIRSAFCCCYCMNVQSPITCCRICGSEQLESILDLGVQALTGVLLQTLPRSVEGLSSWSCAQANPPADLSNCDTVFQRMRCTARHMVIGLD